MVSRIRRGEGLTAVAALFADPSCMDGLELMQDTLLAEAAWYSREDGPDGGGRHAEAGYERADVALLMVDYETYMRENGYV